MNKTIAINLFAAPGAGKSTGAAYIFSQLKMQGINCELVTEYAKDKVWEGTTKVFDNQAYIFGKQYYRMSRLMNEVDVIITDAPLFLSVFYNTNPVLGDNFNNVVCSVIDTFDNFNYFIERDKPYNPKGRFQTEDQVVEMDSKLLQSLNNHSQLVKKSVKGNQIGYNEIVNNILKSL